MPKDIAIFGAGIAGLMAAIALRAQGHHCRVYERSRQSHEAGMGFILVPEVSDRLREFHIDMAGVPLDFYHARDAAGKILYEEKMPVGARSMRRRDLIAALADALAEDALSFDAELEGLEFDQARQITGALLGSGQLVKAELYVAADGGGSLARQVLFPNWPAPPSRVLEIVGLVCSASALQWAGHNFTKLYGPDGGLAVGILPVDTEHVIWYLQFDAERFPPPLENAEARQAFVQKLAGNWAEPIPHLLALTDFTRVHVWRPVDADPVPRFYQGNMVLVGDAAHPLSPFTSQGVASAIADAIALAGAVDAVVNRKATLAQALSDYSDERHAKCAPLVCKGRELAREFLAPLPAKGHLIPIA
jgi:2-polyprenyl-6-methoxyphenol hydroxylase-like FAD-dependent oxidoreductase